MPIRGLSIAETINCGKRDGGKKNYQKCQNGYKFENTMERQEHVIPTLALSHVAHLLHLMAFHTN